jgi:hypothetical protein
MQGWLPVGSHPQGSRVTARPPPVVGGGRAATPKGRGWPRGHPQGVAANRQPPLVFLINFF